MEQTRPCDVSILDLPPKVRRRIYYEADIPKHEFVCLTAKSYRSDTNFNGSTFSLLLTSRKIYEEVIEEIYGNNLIYIRYSDQHSLAALSRLRHIALWSITSLTVHLSVASCGLGIPCDYTLHPWRKTEADRLDQPLSLSDTSTESVLNEWRSIWWERLLPVLGESPKLRLSLVCDVADLQTGRAVIDPLIQLRSPKLLDCSIRLNKRPDWDLMVLVRNAVHNSVAHRNTQDSAGKRMVTKPSTYSFTNLPLELRQQILTFSDLVAPYQEVEWNADHGYYCRQRANGLGSLYPGLLHGSPFPGCFDEPDLVEEDEEESTTPSCAKKTFPSGCFCQARHTAYSSSVRCKCWAPPKALFLVSRSFREDAMSVFFSRNRVVIVPAGGKTWEAVSSAPEKLPPSIFLAQVMPKEALRFLRYLEIVFPPFGEVAPCDYCPHKSTQYLDWQRTLKEVTSHLDRLKLTISVYFPDWQPDQDPFASNRYRDVMTDEHSRAICINYLYAVGPLRQLRGLRTFFAHFAWPQEWATFKRFDYEQCGVLRRKGQERMHELERHAEHTVMVDKRYDSIAAGKYQQRQSRWIEEHKQRSLL